MFHVSTYWCNMKCATNRNKRSRTTLTVKYLHWRQIKFDVYTSLQSTLQKAWTTDNKFSRRDIHINPHSTGAFIQLQFITCNTSWQFYRLCCTAGFAGRAWLVLKAGPILMHVYHEIYLYIFLVLKASATRMLVTSSSPICFVKCHVTYLSYTYKLNICT